MLLPTLLVFTLAVGVGLVLTRVGRTLAERLRLRDLPDGRRKIHSKPVAVIGGVAILVTVPLALGMACWISADVSEAFQNRAGKMLTWAIAATLLAAIGMLDDIRNLRARYKLLGQALVVSVLIVGGDYLIREVSIFGIAIPLGILAVPFTFAWFIIAINALNLLDGMDGMLGTVGTVLFLGLGLMASLTGANFAMLIAIAIAGGLVGFLRYNLPPASVYLGDCGSMLIGMAVALLAIDASLKGPAFVILAPLSLMVLPILDTSAAVLRRKLTGRGLAIGDRGHLHHVLLRHGFSIPRVLVLVTAFGILAAGGAVLSVFWTNDLVAVVAAGSVCLSMVVFQLFGMAEIRLLRARAGSVLRKATGNNGVDLEVRLQGTHSWGDVWSRIVHDAQVLSLTSVCLDVNAPIWHEGYHRRWQRSGAADDPLAVWRVELPLVAQGHLVGRLIVSGERANGCMAEKLAELSSVVRAAERLLTLSPPSGLHPRHSAISDHGSGDAAIPASTVLPA